MASYNWGVDKTYIASADMTSSQVKVAATAGVYAIGILQNNPKSGEEATVRVMGYSKVHAEGGTAITCGSYISTGSLGECIAATSTTACAYILGRAEETLSSGADVMIMVNMFGTPLRTSTYV
jgi:hypothetical protein